MDLKKILKDHKKWLVGEGGVRADLREADLREANLCGADLREADLREANLCGANLRGANLCGADLYGADLYGADLYGADLRGANLRGANLSRADLREANLYGANLYGANLYGANLRGADLREANLSRADLREANLYGANLYGANLYGANLSGANLSGAKNIDQAFWSIYTTFYPLQCPEKGAYIGYKKAGGHIVELEITEDALRSSATSRKCRASKAKVLSITDLDGNPADDQVRSDFDKTFVYKVGETVEVLDFDTNRWEECSTGIHHFITRSEAVKYQ